MSGILSGVVIDFIPLPPPTTARDIRVKARVPQVDLASALGVSVRQVRRWETGKSVPSGRRRQEYGAALDTLAAIVARQGPVVR